LDGTRLILSKVGAVPIVLHRPLEGRSKTVMLTQSRTGTWFAVFLCAVDAELPPPIDAMVGEDVRLSSFAPLSSRMGRRSPTPAAIGAMRLA